MECGDHLKFEAFSHIDIIYLDYVNTVFFINVETYKSISFSYLEPLASESFHENLVFMHMILGTTITWVSHIS